jgi:hypothetical protein
LRRAFKSKGTFVAANAVRRGELAFTISLPASPLSKMELLELNEIVLERFSK